MEISKTFVFPKIAFNGTRKINTPEIEIALACDNGKYEFTASGSIWNSKHTDIIAGGQCLDTMYKYLKHDKLFKEIYRLWRAYHLNGLKCGGPIQEAALKDYKSSSYEDRCTYLESKDLLYEDGIKYGTQWWYHKIPDNDLKEIMTLLS